MGLIDGISCMYLSRDSKHFGLKYCSIDTSDLGLGTYIYKILWRFRSK